ncbi:hypothetical protein GMMP13_640018 [Candidatus Magnetomoraceae bacterium gMMP-13]
MNNNLSDVSFLKELKGLNNIDLAKNQIKVIPAWLLENKLEIRIDDEYAFGRINLFDNPIETPPPRNCGAGNEGNA